MTRVTISRFRRRGIKGYSVKVGRRTQVVASSKKSANHFAKAFRRMIREDKKRRRR